MNDSATGFLICAIIVLFIAVALHVYDKEKEEADKERIENKLTGIQNILISNNVKLKTVTIELDSQNNRIRILEGKKV